MSSLLCWRSVSGVRHAPPPGRPRVSRVAVVGAGWRGRAPRPGPPPPLSRASPRRASHQDEGRARGEVLQSGGQDGQHHHLRVGRDRRPHPAGGHHPPDQRVRMGPGPGPPPPLRSPAWPGPAERCRAAPGRGQPFVTEAKVPRCGRARPPVERHG